MQVFQIWKTSVLEDFQTTCKKSSRRHPGGLPDDIQEVFQTTSRKCGSDFGRLMGSLLGSLLKYNALEDFQEVFQATSRKSSRRLPGSLRSKRLPGSSLTESSSI
ncbi:hypothetical protein YC2023_117540 [Brassica napus]